MPSRCLEMGCLAIAAVADYVFSMDISRLFSKAVIILPDVLAGYSLGLAWAVLVYTFIEGIFMKRKLENVEKK